MKQNERDMQAQRVKAYDTCKAEIDKLVASQNCLSETGLLSIETHHNIPLYIEGYQDQLKELLIKLYQDKIDDLEKAIRLI